MRSTTAPHLGYEWCVPKNTDERGAYVTTSEGPLVLVRVEKFAGPKVSGIRRVRVKYEELNRA